jgi:NAD(P)H-dependent FMN reductase
MTGGERNMTRIGIILGSTRPNRLGEQVARWVYDAASQHGDAAFELVDLRDYPLPHLDEPVPAARGGQYLHAHTRAWSNKIDSFDGFVILTPEYNHSTPGVLKNALDYLYAEWNYKAVGLVSYGSVGGARAAEHLRLVCGALQMAVVPQQVGLSLMTDFEHFSTFAPASNNLAMLDSLLDEVVGWSRALASLRTPGRALAA